MRSNNKNSNQLQKNTIKNLVNHWAHLPEELRINKQRFRSRSETLFAAYSALDPELISKSTKQRFAANLDGIELFEHWLTHYVEACEDDMHDGSYSQYKNERSKYSEAESEEILFKSFDFIKGVWKLRFSCKIFSISTFFNGIHPSEICKDIQDAATSNENLHCLLYLGIRLWCHLL